MIEIIIIFISFLFLNHECTSILLKVFFYFLKIFSKVFKVVTAIVFIKFYQFICWTSEVFILYSLKELLVFRTVNDHGLGILPVNWGILLVLNEFSFGNHSLIEWWASKTVVIIFWYYNRLSSISWSNIKFSIGRSHNTTL